MGGISYGDWKQLNDKLDRIEAALTVELVALRSESAALKEGIASAVDSTDAVERAARAGLPSA